MAYTSINDPSAYFQTKLYTGGTAEAKTFDGNSNLKPDWFWSKKRGATQSHQTADSVRGIANSLRTDTTIAEYSNTETDDLVSFDTNGFTFNGTGDTYNGTYQSSSYVAWCWAAGGGTTSSNTDGSITSTVSANTTSGFSIAKYTGTGANASFGHGLGTTPAVYIIKRLTGANGTWLMYHQSLGIGYHLGLNNTTAQNTNDATFANNTAPDTSKIYLGSWGDLNANGSDFICYSFAEKKGFSKFGSYTGNGNADGPMIYTGFKPAWVLQKNTSVTQGWQLQDNKRLGYNPNNYLLQPHTDQSESALQRVDLLSNGFKVRTTDAGQNASGNNYIYMAFAEHPFVSSTGTPTTAR